MRKSGALMLNSEHVVTCSTTRDSVLKSRAAQTVKKLVGYRLDSMEFTAESAGEGTADGVDGESSPAV